MRATGRSSTAIRWGCGTSPSGSAERSRIGTLGPKTSMRTHGPRAGRPSRPGPRSDPPAGHPSPRAVRVRAVPCAGEPLDHGRAGGGARRRCRVRAPHPDRGLSGALSRLGQRELLGLRSGCGDPPGPLSSLCRADPEPSAQCVNPLGDLLLELLGRVGPVAVQLPVLRDQVRPVLAEPSHPPLAGAALAEVKDDRYQVRGAGRGDGPDGLLHSLVGVGEERDDGRHQDATCDPGLVQLSDRVEAAGRRWRAGLDGAPQLGIDRADGEVRADVRHLGALAEQVEVAEDQRALRQDRERVGEVAERLEDATHQPVPPLGALVRVDVRAHGDVLALPLWGGQLLAEQLLRVDLHDDLRVEVLAVVEVQVGVGLPSEAIQATVTASAIWIDAPAEWHVRRVGDAVDDGPRLDLVERHPPELGRVEGPDHGALLEQGDRDPIVLPVHVEAEVVPAHGHPRIEQVFDSGQPLTMRPCPRSTSGRTARPGTSWPPATRPSTASVSPRGPGPGGCGGSPRPRSGRSARWPAGTCSSSAAGPRSGRSRWRRTAPDRSGSISPANSCATRARPPRRSPWSTAAPRSSPSAMAPSTSCCPITAPWGSPTPSGPCPRWPGSSGPGAGSPSPSPARSCSCAGTRRPNGSTPASTRPGSGCGARRTSRRSSSSSRMASGSDSSGTAALRWSG